MNAANFMSNRVLLGIGIVIGLLLLFVAGVAGCGPVTVAPPPTSTVTVTITPTRPKGSPIVGRPTATRDPAYPQLEKLTVLGAGALPDILRSHDGKMIVTSDQAAIHILNASDGREISSIPFSNESQIPTTVEAISPNNRFVIVSSCCVTAITVFDIETKEELGSMTSAFGYVGNAAFLPDSQSFIFLDGASSTGGPSESICIYEIPETAPNPNSNASNIDCYPNINSEDGHNVFTPPVLSPDGRLVAAGYSDRSQNILYIWDAQQKSIRFALKGQPSHITAVDFSPDGKLLAASGEDGLVRLWDPATGTLKRTITGFLDDIDDVSFTPDGRSLIVSVSERPDVVYDLVSENQSPAVSPTLDPLAVEMMQKNYLLGGWYGSRVEFSPDGKNVAIAHSSVQVWDVQTRQLRQTFLADTRFSVAGLAYSPDGEHLAVVSQDGSVFSWNILTGQQELALSAAILEANQPLLLIGKNDPFFNISSGIGSDHSVAFSPDSKRLALGNRLTVDVWGVATASKLLTLEQTEPAAQPTSISFSDDGRFIYAVLDGNRDVAMWNASTGELVRRRDLPVVDDNSYSSIALRGALFARNNYDDDSYWIELWDIALGTLRKLPTPFREIEPLRFSTDGRFLLAGVGNRIYVWRVDTGQLIFISDMGADVGDMTINPAGDLLATTDLGQISLWDIEPHLQKAFAANFATPIPDATEIPYPPLPTDTPQPTRVVQPLPLPKRSSAAIGSENATKLRVAGRFGDGHITRVDWDENGLRLTGSSGVYQYDPATLKETRRFTLDGMSGSQSRLLPDGRLLIVGATFNGKTQLWDLQKNEMLVELPGIDQPAISPDGKWLALVRESGGLVTWNVESGQPGVLLRGPWYGLRLPIFSPDGKRIAALQSGRTVRLWDAATGGITNGLGGPVMDITNIAFSRDGRYVTAVAGGSAWVWRTEPELSPVEIKLSDGKDGESLVSAVAINPTNALVAVGASDHTIGLYDRQSAKLLGSLTGHSSSPVALAFSPGGDRLLSMDADGQMMLWNVATRKLLLGSHTLQTSINGFVIRRDGRLSAWGENTIWTFRAGDASLQGTAYLSDGKILSVSPAGDLAAVYSPFQVSLYNVVTGLLKQTLPDQPQKIDPLHYTLPEIPREFLGATFDHTGKQLATFGTGGTWLYSLPSGEKLNHIEGRDVNLGEFSLDGDWLLTALPDDYFFFKTCPSLFTVQRAEMMMEMCPLNGFRQARISPDKRWVAALIYSPANRLYSTLQVADTSTGQISKQLSFGDTDLSALAFNPDASLIAVGRLDGKIALVDFATMKIVASFTAHQGQVNSLAFSEDGRSLFSLGEDRVLKIWSLP